MKIFIICSKAFYDRIPSIKEELESKGHIITLPNSYDDPNRESRYRGTAEHAMWKKEMINHSEKVISGIDSVLVLNYEKNGIPNYLGGATFLEMYDAFRLGKQIYMMNDIPDGMLQDEIIGLNPVIINGNLSKIQQISSVVVDSKSKELRDLIEDFKPFNEQEAKDKEIILKWISIFDNLLTRENEFAHLTSSAFVVNKARDKALMIYHNIYDSWAWTGGHADGEVDLLGVALREIQEETGIKNVKPVMTEIFLLDTLPVLGHIKRGKYIPAHTHLSVAYLVEADDNEILIVKEDENSGVEWFPIDEVVEKSTELYMKPIYEKAIKKLKSMK